MSADHYYKQQEGYANPDEVKPIFTAVMQCKTGSMPTARISSTVQRASEYGSVKCSTTVTIECPQDRAWIDNAAKVSFKLALEYCNDGYSYLNPSEPPIEGPR